MIGLFVVVLLVGGFLLWRRRRASRLAGLNESAPTHTVMVGPRSRRVSLRKHERL